MPDPSPDDAARTPASMTLPIEPTVEAPDGSDVRVLLTGTRGGMAHFELAPGRISTPIRHRTVEEIWYIVGGRGRMWRRLGDHESTIELAPGVCLNLPVGTHFQFRADGPEPLAAIGVTMPPWPGDHDAVVVDGHPDWVREDQD